MELGARVPAVVQEKGPAASPPPAAPSLDTAVTLLLLRPAGLDPGAWVSCFRPVPPG